ncbi:MAG: adenine nucleotide alpha hydrolase [Geminicoccaceae bacterium]
MAHPMPEVEKLAAIFESCRPAAVAVSGGVDSMTLAFLAHRHLGDAVTMFHTLSPAVPPLATERVEAYGKKEGWQLQVLDAGEFADENYLANPANRCFFCKSNLYGSLAKATGAQLLSGTNLDDLGDWRPGLKAASNNDVRHPFVEAEIDKAKVRALARNHGLTDLADLPAAPCLSSRVETGIRIDAEMLRFIDGTEAMLRERLSPDTVRCRVRQDGVVIELDRAALEGVTENRRGEIEQDIRENLPANAAGLPISFQAYRRGSAFLRETLDGR